MYALPPVKHSQVVVSSANTTDTADRATTYGHRGWDCHSVAIAYSPTTICGIEYPTTKANK